MQPARRNITFREMKQKVADMDYYVFEDELHLVGLSPLFETAYRTFKAVSLTVDYHPRFWMERFK